jgi:hypothetical protein
MLTVPRYLEKLLRDIVHEAEALGHTRSEGDEHRVLASILEEALEARYVSDLRDADLTRVRPLPGNAVFMIRTHGYPLVVPPAYEARIRTLATELGYSPEVTLEALLLLVRLLDDDRRAARAAREQVC